jgi:hypothetical protein
LFYSQWPVRLVIPPDESPGFPGGLPCDGVNFLPVYHPASSRDCRQIPSELHTKSLTQ